MLSTPARPAFLEKQESAGYPQIRNSRAIAYVAMTMIILTYATLFGAIPILVLYAIWFPHIIYKGRFTLRPSRDILPIILFGGLCVLSTLWSDQREITAKGSLEFASMIVCTIIVARIVSIEALIKGTIIGLFLILLVPFKGGSYSIDGLFGSKNQVGGIAELGLYVSIIYMCQKKRRLEKMLFCAVPVLLFCACLYYGHSATALVSFAAALGMSLLAYLLVKFPQKMRMPILIAAMFFIAVLIAISFYMGWQNAGLGALGKDSSLTGRTYLWGEGLRFGMERPFLGLGYQAFWVVGRPEAENLWFKLFIFTRSGFHFHNLFINVFVDLGLCGVLLMAYIYLSTCVASFRFVVRHGANLASIFFIGLSLMFLLRALAEVDTTGPFGLGTLLFFSIVPRIVEWRNEKPDTKSPSTAPIGLPWKTGQRPFKMEIS